MRKTSLGGYAAEGQLPFPEKRLRPIDAALNHVLMNRQSDRLPKRRFDMRHTDPGHRGKFLKRKVLGQIVLYVSDHLFKLRPQTTFAGLRSGFR